jgi:hypothetical protein
MTRPALLKRAALRQPPARRGPFPPGSLLATKRGQGRRDENQCQQRYRPEFSVLFLGNKNLRIAAVERQAQTAHAFAR